MKSPTGYNPRNHETLLVGLIRGLLTCKTEGSLKKKERDLQKVRKIMTQSETKQKSRI